jgi:hypothetical protein
VEIFSPAIAPNFTNEHSMPYDPAKPAAEMRAQLAGLKALIDATPAGPPGPSGPAGPAGPQGPAFSNIHVGAVATGTPGSPAGAQVSVNGNDVELTFTIPAGETGPAGEVSQSALNSAVMGTAQNPTGVSTLSLSISDPPTKAEVEAILAFANAMLSALQRQP